ncbi:hypothetical protein PR048_001511 [Dryococelus australis]|uniref:Uncharacterized protein n=1 Tax=Dryococelus australis TaxID=614101 RepID=A0ABQ9IK05_9NEOP|nr:hypothetical protein PR048_001511 [Dryococelus australis]
MSVHYHLKILRYSWTQKFWVVPDSIYEVVLDFNLDHLITFNGHASVKQVMPYVGMETYREKFSLGKCVPVPYKIHVTDNIPVRCTPYQFSITKLLVFCQIMSNLEWWKIICHSLS